MSPTLYINQQMYKLAFYLLKADKINKCKCSLDDWLCFKLTFAKAQCLPVQEKILIENQFGAKVSPSFKCNYLPVFQHGLRGVFRKGLFRSGLNNICWSWWHTWFYGCSTLCLWVNVFHIWQPVVLRIEQGMRHAKTKTDILTREWQNRTCWAEHGNNVVRELSTWHVHRMSDDTSW